MNEAKEIRVEARPQPRRGGFLWGATCGVLAALALLVANDLTVRVVPVPGEAFAGAMESTPVDAPRVHFLNELPPAGFHVFADTIEVAVEPVPGGARVAVPEGTRKLAVRGAHGTVWSTRIGRGSAAGDTLRPVWGGEIVLDVHPRGPAGEVYLDGRPAGVAPGTIENVPPGWHLVDIRQGDAILFQDECRVSPGEVAVIPVPPSPPWGSGTITVHAFALGEDGLQPIQGASVRIDGEPTGRTPLETTLPAGLHSVTVSRAGYPDVVEIVELPAGQMRSARAEFGREDLLEVSIHVPPSLAAGRPGAVAVQVRANGELTALASGELHLLRPGREESVALPLAAGLSDRSLWVAAVPRDLVARAGELRGYARCVDAEGRRGVSEIVTVQVQ